jgi:hypothetical protein
MYACWHKVFAQVHDYALWCAVAIAKAHLLMLAVLLHTTHHLQGHKSSLSPQHWPQAVPSLRCGATPMTPCLPEGTRPDKCSHQRMFHYSSLNMQHVLASMLEV